MVMWWLLRSACSVPIFLGHLQKLFYYQWNSLILTESMQWGALFSNLMNFIIGFNLKLESIKLELYNYQRFQTDFHWHWIFRFVHIWFFQYTNSTGEAYRSELGQVCFVTTFVYRSHYSMIPVLGKTVKWRTALVWLRMWLSAQHCSGVWCWKCCTVWRETWFSDISFLCYILIA